MRLFYDEDANETYGFINHVMIDFILLSRKQKANGIEEKQQKQWNEIVVDI